ncbi:MAG: NAD(P)H-dependent oxidoreductase [Alistipes sp.]|nr:NAD(P)H-dependent oxidoreductase [Alistipes sp.]
MKHIVIISSSVRTGRLSHRVALYLHRYLTEHQLADAEILDLKSYRFPLFEERFSLQENLPDKLVDFTERLVASDGTILVSPVYNASFPASLKNVIDLYLNEWYHQPVAVVSVSSGKVPGIATVQALQALMLKLGALVVPRLSTVIAVDQVLNEEGEPQNPVAFEELMRPMLDELLWLIQQTNE